MKRERRNYVWLPVIAWMIVIFMLSAQPANQSIILSGSVTRFLTNGLNQLAAFIEHFTRAQGTVVFLAGILVLIHLLETQKDEPEIFGIKKSWIIGGAAIFLVFAISLFLFVDLVQDTSFSYAGRLIRKSAHFIAYLILGFLVSHAMKNEASTATAWKRRGASLLFCVVYAISDEFHQIFVPGRGPLVKDVFIDGSGAALGIILSVVAKQLWRRWKKSSLKTPD
jgi:VanZ family protein